MKSILMISLHGYVGANAEFGKPDTGGQVVYVLELAERFSRLGKRVDLVTRQFEDQPEYDIVDDNYSVWRIPFGGKKFIRKEDMHDHLKKFVTNTLAAIKKENKKYDVVYSHYWDAGWAGQKIAEELGISHVHTPHSVGWWKQHTMGSDMDEKEMEKTYRFKERIRKEYFVYQMCNHIIATTIPQVDLLTKQYDVLPKNCTMIPPGIDENRFFPVPSKENDRIRTKYDIHPTDILTLGRMAHNKGYDLLIQALPTVFELCPEARLVAAIGSDNSNQDDDGVKKLKQLATDMWIHESFTTYSENLYVEYHYGKEAAADYVIGIRARIANDKPIIGYYEVNKEGSIDMYYKGANMLHTLRQLIEDDEKWRQILRKMNVKFYHQTVNNQQIERFLSHETGIDLTAFFNQYLRTTKIPYLEYSIDKKKLKYRWTNIVDDFDMPIQIKINKEEQWLFPNSEWKILENESAISLFEIDRDFYVESKKL